LINFERHGKQIGQAPSPATRDTINQFIQEATKSLTDDYDELVVIADNLDRIVPIAWKF